MKYKVYFSPFETLQPFPKNLQKKKNYVNPAEKNVDCKTLAPPHLTIIWEWETMNN